MTGHVLLDDAFAAQPVGISDHGGGPVAQPRQHGVRHALVVVSEVGLANSVVREQHFVGVRDLHA